VYFFGGHSRGVGIARSVSVVQGHRIPCSILCALTVSHWNSCRGAHYWTLHSDTYSLRGSYKHNNKKNCHKLQKTEGTQETSEHPAAWDTPLQDTKTIRTPSGPRMRPDPGNSERRIIHIPRVCSRPSAEPRRCFSLHNSETDDVRRTHTSSTGSPQRESSLSATGRDRIQIAHTDGLLDPVQTKVHRSIFLSDRRQRSRPGARGSPRSGSPFSPRLEQLKLNSFVP
jgi:hypothetical protein